MTSSTTVLNTSLSNSASGSLLSNSFLKDAILSLIVFSSSPILPDYDFKQSEIGSSVEGGTSVSGIAGSLITAAAAVLIGAALKLYKNHLISINRN